MRTSPHGNPAFVAACSSLVVAAPPALVSRRRTPPTATPSAPATRVDDAATDAPIPETASPFDALPEAVRLVDGQAVHR